MTIKQVKQLYNSAPFKPFIIYLADGRRIPVKHREFMATSPSGRTIVVYEPDDSFNIIDLLLVTSLEVKNGKASKKRD
jgi:hypothetical protein